MLSNRCDMISSEMTYPLMKLCILRLFVDNLGTHLPSVLQRVHVIGYDMQQIIVLHSDTFRRHTIGPTLGV